MPATDVPGLGDILAWAQFLGMDVTETVRRAQMLMQTDPATVRVGGERLGMVATGLDADGTGLQRAGTGVLAAGMSGQTADAFGPHHTGLVTEVADTGNVARQLAAELDTMATTFEEGQRTVVTATGATATMLRMLQASP